MDGPTTLSNVDLTTFTADPVGGSSSSLPYFTPHNQPLKMEQIKCSETSAFNNQTPGKYPKDYTQLVEIWSTWDIFLQLTARQQWTHITASKALWYRKEAILILQMLGLSFFAVRISHVSYWNNSLACYGDYVEKRWWWVGGWSEDASASMVIGTAHKFNP